MPQNAGKGGALQAGVEKATGDHILTMDADVATHPNRLIKWIKESPGKTLPQDAIWIGSREHQESEVKGEPLRRLAGFIFNLVVQLFTSIKARDTQCGFKLYPSAVAKPLFAKLRNKGWAHDVELIYDASLKDVAIVSKPVKWDHVEESKVNLVQDSLKMFLGSFLIGLQGKWRHFVAEPLSSPFKPIGIGLSKTDAKVRKGEAPLFRFFFLALALMLLIGMPYLSFDYGISGDEHVQKTYGELILKHFETDGAYKNDKGENALNFKNLFYYGGGFDTVCAWFNQKIGAQDEFEMRHMLNALVGFLMMFYTGLLAKELTRSWFAAFLALLFMALSPRLFGHSMNNPKDIPFAAAYVFSVLHLIRFVKELPRPTNRTVLMLTLGIAAAINVRVGGILLIAYTGLFSLITVLARKNLRPFLSKPMQLSNGIGKAIFVAVASFFLGMVFWPYARQAPLSAPFTALSEMSNFSTSIRMLFEGKHLWSDELPWYYIPKYISIVSPLVVLAGAVLGLIFLVVKHKKWDTLIWVLAGFTAVFPVTYAIIKGSALYDGMRHFLFVYPIIVVFAAGGWKAMIHFRDHPVNRYGLAFVMSALLFLPASFMVRNHPYQSTYFNEIVGGVDKAYGYYELDYWMNSMKGLANWFGAHNAEMKTGEKVTVGSDCSDPVGHYIKKINPSSGAMYTRYRNRHEKNPDYYFFYTRFVDKDLLLSGAWPPGEIVHEEKVDHTTIAAIVKHEPQFDYFGFQAQKKKNLLQADSLYALQLKAQPNHELALLERANINTSLQRYDVAQQMLDQLFQIAPRYQNGWFSQGILYLNQNKAAEALEAFNTTVDINYKYRNAYYYQAVIYNSQNDAASVVKAIENYDKQNGNLPQAYDMGIKAAESINDQFLKNYFLCKLLFYQKKYQESYQALQTVLRMKPDYQPAVDLQEVFDKANNQ